MITDYQLVRVKVAQIEELESAVMAAIAGGWQPYERPQQLGAWFVQAMVKTDLLGTDPNPIMVAGTINLDGGL